MSKRFKIYRELPYMKQGFSLHFLNDSYWFILVAWRSHIVSQIHAIGICYGACTVVFDPHHYNDPVFAYSSNAEWWLSYSFGYFIWSVLVALIPSLIHNPFRDCFIVFRNYEGFAFIYHGFNCLFLCMAVFRPVYQFYGLLFLLFETSTIFLNIHWFCDKVGMTGSRLQMVNGVFLLGSFLGVRLLFGTYHIAGLFCTSIIFLSYLHVTTF